MGEGVGPFFADVDEGDFLVGCPVAADVVGGDETGHGKKVVRLAD